MGAEWQGIVWIVVTLLTDPYARCKMLRARIPTDGWSARRKEFATQRVRILLLMWILCGMSRQRSRCGAGYAESV